MKSTTTRLLIGLLLSVIVPAEVLADASGEGTKLFAMSCASCHGQDGRAKTFRAVFNKARDLSNAQWQAGITDAAIIESIKVGRGKMPAFAAKLDDLQLNALLQYVRALRRPSSAPASPQTQTDGAQQPSLPDPEQH